MFNGFALALAWPETPCKRAGAWYDYPMHYLGLSKNGYYTVGHAAVVLIDDETQTCHYFDFGRYHAPYNHGRVRSSETDYDLRIKTKAILSSDTKQLVNLDEILEELYHNSSTHGSGTLYAAATRIRFDNAMDLARQLQQKEFIHYGPFITNGTNCSRFVSSVIQGGNPALLQNISLKFPLTISPTPMWNLKALWGKISCFDHTSKRKQAMLQPEMNILYS